MVCGRLQRTAEEQREQNGAYNCQGAGRQAGDEGVQEGAEVHQDEEEAESLAAGAARLLLRARPAAVRSSQPARLQPHRTHQPGGVHGHDARSRRPGAERHRRLGRCPGQAHRRQTDPVQRAARRPKVRAEEVPHGVVRAEIQEDQEAEEGEGETAAHSDLSAAAGHRAGLVRAASRRLHRLLTLRPRSSARPPAPGRLRVVHGAFCDPQSQTQHRPASAGPADGRQCRRRRRAAERDGRGGGGGCGGRSYSGPQAAARPQPAGQRCRHARQVAAGCRCRHGQPPARQIARRDRVILLFILCLEP